MIQFDVIHCDHGSFVATCNSVQTRACTTRAEACAVARAQFGASATEHPRSIAKANAGPVAPRPRARAAQAHTFTTDEIAALAAHNEATLAALRADTERHARRQASLQAMSVRMGGVEHVPTVELNGHNQTFSVIGQRK